LDDGASSSDLPCPVLPACLLACLPLGTLPWLAFQVSGDECQPNRMITCGRTTKPLACRRWLRRTWHARTHAAWLVCWVVVSVSCRSCRACHVMIHSCRLRHLLQRQRPRRRGSLHGPWMDARVAADAMRASPSGSSALCLLLLAAGRWPGERAIASPLHHYPLHTPS
jgi:hypothetical protein